MCATVLCLQVLKSACMTSKFVRHADTYIVAKLLDDALSFGGRAKVNIGGSYSLEHHSHSYQ